MHRRRIPFVATILMLVVGLAPPAVGQSIILDVAASDLVDLAVHVGISRLAGPP